MPLLLREAIGGTIRRARTERQRTLRDVSREARVSLGYLSEIERGRKEPSSELLASICDALALSLPDLLDDVAESMRPARPVRPVRASRPRPLTLAGPIDPALRSAVEEAFAPEPGGASGDGDTDGTATPGAGAVTEPAEPAPLDTTQFDSTQFETTQFETTQFETTQFETTQFETTQPGSEDPGAEALDRDGTDRDGTDAPVGDAPDTVPDTGESADDDEETVADPTPTVRLVGLVTVSPAPVVYAA